MPKFTIFLAHKSSEPQPNKCEGMWLHEGALEEAIFLCVERFGRWWSPVAWEFGIEEGDSDDRQARSFAAGRLIDCIDGKYVARGIGEVAFRAGACYRQRGGAVVRVSAISGDLIFVSSDILGSLEGGGSRRLSDGRYVHGLKQAEHLADLLPGEVDADGNPLAASTALNKNLARHLAHAARDLVNEATKPEPIRAPLPYFAERAVFDPLGEFVVTSRDTHDDFAQTPGSFGAFVSPDIARS